MSRRTVEITTDLMLRAYRHGLFPMAETRRGERLYWLDPERRGVLPLDRFHLPRRLARAVTTPGSTPRSSACSASCTGSATPIRWKPASTGIWSAASMV